MGAYVKNQHHVPRFYLKSFADVDGYLCAMRRGVGGLGAVFRSKPEGVCSENYLYEVKRQASDCEEKFIAGGVIEGNLSRIENRMAENYRELLGYLSNGELPGGDECSQLITQLACLIAFFVCRNPQWLGEMRDDASSVAAELVASGFLSEAVASNMAEEGYGGELDAIVELAIMDTALFRVYEGTPLHSMITMMLGMDCRFLVAPEECEFVTASFPVYAAWENEDAHDPASIYFPLSSRYAVVLRLKAENERLVSIAHVDKEAVDSLNCTLMNGNGVWDTLLASEPCTLETLALRYRPVG